MSASFLFFIYKSPHPLSKYSLVGNLKSRWLSFSSCFLCLPPHWFLTSSVTELCFICIATTQLESITHHLNNPRYIYCNSFQLYLELFISLRNRSLKWVHLPSLISSGNGGVYHQYTESQDTTWWILRSLCFENAGYSVVICKRMKPIESLTKIGSRKIQNIRKVKETFTL